MYFRIIFWGVLIAFCVPLHGAVITGRVTESTTGQPLIYCTVRLLQPMAGTVTDADGAFRLIVPDTLTTARLVFNRIGYRSDTLLLAADQQHITVALQPGSTLTEVVVTGSLQPVRRLESTVPVDVITPALFARNPSVCLFDAVGMLNGVQPQVSCNVCSAGDIRINGMDGPYTLLLIDGMPIVSSLSTVYGLSGIPVSLIERIELVKGPASSLYGSEAMGGIINIITRDPECTSRLSVDVSGTSWQEFAGDAAVSYRIGKAHGLLGVNTFNYNKRHDSNGDGFTDMTLQNRISVFNKYTFSRPQQRLAALAGRVVVENRWGGQLNWDKDFRGSDRVYGESIVTRRAELIGQWQLPLREKVMVQVSFNSHLQDSWYGITTYRAAQHVAFGQVYWEKTLSRHALLAGVAYRFTHYDDNTPATAAPDGVVNSPAQQPLPGLFVQDELHIGKRGKLLAGYRLDHAVVHGLVHSPRLAARWQAARNTTLRAGWGTGFRVVNLFTEDHAALSGAREVIIRAALQPERSQSININLFQRITRETFLLTLDASAFYTRFSNKIVADYDTDPNEIRYENLNGFAVSQGASLNADLSFNAPFTLLAGITYLDVFIAEPDASGQLQRWQQLHAPHWSGTFTAGYTFAHKWVVDLSGRWLGPMRLPVQPNDFRPAYSPWFCLLNVQVRKQLPKQVELYGGVRNLLNFLPQHPIMRPFDPFDQQVNDPVNNPNGYTFDPSYTYAPMQGIRMFVGVRWVLK